MSDTKIPAGMAIALAAHEHMKTLGNMGDWQGRHMAAWTGYRKVPFESAIGNMISAWLMYADDHSQRFESTIGEDGVLG